MIRFLILCAIIALAILGFRFMNDYDYNINLSFLNYQIETSFFTFVASFLLVQLIIIIIIKLLFSIFDIPNIVKNLLRQRKQKQINQKLLESFAEFLTNKKEKALLTFKGLLPSLDQENKEPINAILSALVEGTEAPIPYLKTLLDKRHYSFYAAKRLAEIYYESANYKEAEQYAVKAFNENDTDVGLVLLLIRIYAKQKLWQKLVFVVSKLQRADQRKLKVHAKEIANYYYLGAQDLIHQNEDDEASQFLEFALTIKPDHVNSLRLYVEMNISKKNVATISKILVTGFAARPSFEIAEIYAKYTGDLPENIYRNLAKIVDPKQYKTIFLAITAYLGIDNKVTRLENN